MSTIKKGSLTMIVGCMSCGKSDELIRHLVRARIARRRVVAFSPKHDTRSPVGSIASRNGNSFPSVLVADPSEMMDLFMRDGPWDYVGIDEVQFFGSQIVSAVEFMIDGGAHVVASGLDTVYDGTPFGEVPDLLAVADRVQKLDAVCMVCGAPATRSQIKVPVPKNPPDGFFVGGDEKYEARCRDCHIPHPTEPL